MDTPDFKEFVGCTPDEVAKKISTMCDEEEKLDAVLAVVLYLLPCPS